MDIQKLLKSKKLPAILIAMLLIAAICVYFFSLPEGFELFDPTDTTPGYQQTEPSGSLPGSQPTTPTTPTTAPIQPPIDEDGEYNSKEDVALYIHTYGRLPRNYVTKSFAQNVLKCSTSRVEDYWPGGAIGGDVFQNREGRLPSAPGRTWTECDINTWGKYARGAERIVFSNDGLIYYTSDHYNTFVLLYGELS